MRSDRVITLMYSLWFRSFTGIEKDSFHVGLRLERMVLVFCLVSFLGSGMSLSLTYGSDRPLGSMGIMFLPSDTEGNKKKKTMLICL